MTNPEKPMQVVVPAGIKFNFNDYTREALGLVLLRAVQLQGKLLDEATTSSEWRKIVYKSVFVDTTTHNQEGTGSKDEADIFAANKLLSQILGVSN
ncbi:MAG: hypothetical protein JWS10_882 [Cypionkella sp.]|uniref:hypothetical protein n=1 Tax=Cypionkella sp. TaxID=2811411 RepID=UPI00260F1639|nr:hypothetical protein [Cypionkella sp.]MDB5658267.1 hypothetical protein [Cypionkella sp.]